MTYAVAWHNNSEVYFAADTALTTKSSEELSIDFEYSSFGQKHVIKEQNHEKVEERVIKFIANKNIVILFAGNYELAIKISKDFYSKIDEGLNPEESLKLAIFLNNPSDGQVVQLVVGYYDKAPK